MVIIVESQEPTRSIQSDEIVLFPDGGSLKYKTQNGTFTLSTGVSHEEIQDLTANLLKDSNEIDFEYDDLAAELTATLKDSGVSPGEYTNPNIEINSKGIVTGIEDGPSLILGDNFEEFEDLTSASTNSTNPFTLSTFNSTIKQPGKYRIGVFLNIEGNSTSNDARFRLTINGVDVGSIYSEEHKDTSSTQFNWRNQFFYYQNTIENTKTIDVEGWTESSGNLVLKECRIEMWRVST